ncbi:hypothetical protein WJX73_005112 [Symbiochloris irregularis]|uniref:EamA domain-containing protein n=1 Tax=Symbiochloris irregularis TaxID=706552 RepID=A0AAW1NXN0_9CHLO
MKGVETNDAQGAATDAAAVEDTATNTAPAPVEATKSALSTLGEVLLLISPFFFWGTSMVAMKELSPHTTPLFVSAVRLLPAGAVVVAWATLKGKPQPKTFAAWWAIALFALADGTCFQGFLAEGLQRTTAGLGSIIIDSQPLTVALLATLLLGENFTSASAAGLVLGILGLTLLEVPQEAVLSLPQQIVGFIQHGDLPAAGGSALSIPPISEWGRVWDSGAWWMLLAAQSMAVGTVLVPWVSKKADNIMATGYHMLLGGLPLAVLAAVQEGDALAERLPQLTGLDYLLLAYVSLLGSAASYAVFFYNAGRGNLTRLSSLTFLTPMFAAGAGFLALNETLTPWQLGGGAVTLGAVALINSAPRNEQH